MTEQLLIQQNPHWTGRKYTNLIDRALAKYIAETLDMKEAIILTGIRRSGKSTIYKLIINHILNNNVNPKSVLMLNYDEPAFIQYANPEGIRKLIGQAEKLTGTKVEYLFLDEIQNIEQWEKFVKISYDTEIYKKIYITGSNAKVLDSQYITLLSGRYLAYQVRPLSIAEIYRHKGWNSMLDLLNNKNQVLNTIDTILKYGAFPQVYKTARQRSKAELIKTYYDTILLKDCIYMGQVRDPKYFRYLTYYAITNVASPQSYRSLAKATGSNDITVKNYLEILQDSYIIDIIENWATSQKLVNKTHKKIYAADNGLVSIIGFNLTENLGKLFENMVYTELKKMLCDAKIYYSKDAADIDFIVKRGNRFTAVQVTYELNQYSYKREINNLKKIKQAYNLDNAVIITYDQEDETDGINIVPVWKYFAGIQDN